MYGGDAVANDPDLSVLAGYVRNRIKAGQSAQFMYAGRRVFIVPTTAFGDTLPGMLVAVAPGASIVVEPDTPLGTITFVAAGFRLHFAVFLVNLFLAIRGKPLKQPQANDRTMNGPNG